MPEVVITTFPSTSPVDSVAEFVWYEAAPDDVHRDTTVAEGCPKLFFPTENTATSALKMLTHAWFDEKTDP